MTYYMDGQKTLLVAVNDVFFYSKIRDALRPQGYILERIRKQGDVIEKASTFNPAAFILNMNDDSLNAPQILQDLKTDQRLKDIPVLAFANHEEVDTWRNAKDLGVNKIVSRNEFSSRTLALLEEVVDTRGLQA